MATRLLSMELATDSPSTIRVIDDDDYFRTSMMRLLSAAGLQAVCYRCVGEFLMTLEMTLERNWAGCILIDITLPGRRRIDWTKAAALRKSAQPIICVTRCNDVATSVEAMKQGVFDYILKPVSAERVMSSVRRALSVDAARRAAERELRELRSRFARLTQVERAVLFGIASSRRNKQIAADLDLCERTIKARRARMMHKLEIASLPDLIKAAMLLEDTDTQTSACS